MDPRRSTAASPLDLLSDFHRLLGTQRPAGELLVRMAEVLVAEYGALRAEVWRVRGAAAERAVAAGADLPWPDDVPPPDAGGAAVREPAASRAGDTSFVAVPGEAAGEPRALVAVWTEAPPEDERRRVLDLFAEHAALAVLDDETRARTERTVRQLAVLHAYALELQRDLDPRAVADALLAAVHEGLGFPRALVFMRDGERMTAFASAGVPHAEVADIAVPLDEPGPLRDAVQARQPIVVSEPKQDARMDAASEAASDAPNALVAVPLVGLGGDVIGVLTVDDGGRKEMVTPELLQALGVFSEQAALALQNATLVHDTGRTAATLAAIVEASDAGVIVYTPDQRLGFASERAEELIGAPLRPHIGEPTFEVIRRVISPRLVDREGFERLVRYQFEHPEETFRTQLELVDGSILERYFSPVTDATGRNVGHLVLYRDVTGRERFIEEVAGLADISSIFARGGELEELLPQVHETIARILRVRIVVLWRHDPRERRFTAYGSPHGAEPQPQAVGYEQDPVAAAVLSGEPFVSNDLAADARLASHRELFLAAGVNAVAAVPLVRRGEVWGVLGVYDARDARELGDRDVRLLSVLGAQLSSFLTNAELTRARMDLAEMIGRVDEVGGRIVAEGSVDGIVRRAARSLVEDFGMALGAVWLHEDGELVLAASEGPPGALTEAAGRIPVGEGTIGAVADMRAPYVVEDVAGEPALDARWRRDEGVASCAAHPLVVGEDMVGVLGGFSRELVDRASLDLLGSIARFTAGAVAKMRALEQQQLIASSLQQGLIPEQLPMLPGTQVSARYFSATSGADVGGDLFDVFALDGRYAFFIADVSGKGVAAASTASMVKHALRALATRETEPERILEYLNRTVLEQGGGQFVTALLAIHDPERRAMVLCAAGHPPPILRRADGTTDEVAVSGPALGLFADAAYTSEEVSPSSGDLFVLYTDGVTECRSDRDFYGVERLAEAVGAGGTPEALADAIVEQLSEFCGGRFGDDVGLLVVGIE